MHPSIVKADREFHSIDARFPYEFLAKFQILGFFFSSQLSIVLRKERTAFYGYPVLIEDRHYFLIKLEDHHETSIEKNFK